MQNNPIIMCSIICTLGPGNAPLVLVNGNWCVVIEGWSLADTKTLRSFEKNYNCHFLSKGMQLKIYFKVDLHTACILISKGPSSNYPLES